MELKDKLQELRKQKSLTQEELAKALHVSRAAVSKWESGRGYPNIDSLKDIAQFFGVTVDELLAKGQLLAVAKESENQTKTRFRTLVCGLLDISAVLTLFLPFFTVNTNAVPLISLDGVQPYMKVLYFVFVLSMLATGVLTLALPSDSRLLPTRRKITLSLALGACFTVLLIISLQPYAAVFIFVLWIIKALLLFK